MIILLHSALKSEKSTLAFTSKVEHELLEERLGLLSDESI